MSGSSSQYWRRSLPLTSALFPRDTKVEIPRPSSAERASNAMPRPPDCDAKPTLPAIGRNGAKVASIAIAGFVLTTPMQLGPIMRIPLRRAVSTRSCSARPCAASTSAKPAEITTSPCTCFRTQSSTTAATPAAGTHTTARSTGPGTASTVGYACTPATDVAFGLMGCTGPQKSPASRLRSTPLPMVPVRRLAPTTAMEVGERMRATERASETCSRWRCAPTEAPVGSMSNETSTMPPSVDLWTSNPASANTASIRALLIIVMATKRLTPCSRAIAARCSSITVPSPRPCCSSSTVNDTSASSAAPLRRM